MEQDQNLVHLIKTEPKEDQSHSCVRLSEQPRVNAAQDPIVDVDGTVSDFDHVEHRKAPQIHSSSDQNDAQRHNLHGFPPTSDRGHIPTERQDSVSAYQTESSSDKDSDDEGIQAQNVAKRDHLDSARTDRVSASASIVDIAEDQISMENHDRLVLEAKEFFRPDPPPFVIKLHPGSKHRAGDSRILLLAAKDSKYPTGDAPKVRMVYRAWDENFGYATVDVGGRREIVMLKSGGGGGGAACRLWLGAVQGFTKTPIAFLQHNSYTPAARKRKDSTSINAVDASSQPSGKRILRASKPIRAGDGGIVYNWADENDDEHDYALKQKPPMEAALASLSTDSDSSSSDDENSFVRPSAPLTPGSSLPRTFAESRQHTFRPLDTDSDSKDRILLRLRKEGKTLKEIAKYMAETTGEESHLSTWSVRARRLEGRYEGARANEVAPRKSTRTPKRVDILGEQTEGPHSLSTPAKRSFRSLQQRKSSTKRFSFRSANSDHSSNLPSYIAKHQTFSSKPSAANNLKQRLPENQTSHRFDPADSADLPQIAIHKLNRTILRILHSGSFIPLKLRSCATISSLFDTVKDLCGLNYTGEQIQTLKVIFTWISEGDSNRSILLKEQYKDSFEFLLETVDEAPCWESDSGRCTVDIEVV